MTTLAETRKSLEAQKKLAHAMDVCGAVAKLYKKHGQPPKWVSVTSPVNRASRRQKGKHGA